MPRNLRYGLLILAYGAAWLLPSVVVNTAVFTDQPLKLESMRGWSATQFALSAVLPEPYHVDAPWPRAILMITSAISNVFFVAGIVLALRWPHHITIWWERLSWLAAAVNTHWFVSPVIDRGSLRVGYYLWVLSFALLAYSLRVDRRARANQLAA